MANVKITDLTAYTDPVSTDVLPIVDVTNDVTKKVSIADVMENAGSGSLANCGIAFDGDPNTGLYRAGADQVAVVTGGTARLSATTTALTAALPVDVPLGTAGAPTVTFTGDLNTGIYSPGADQVAISTNGTGRLFVDSNGRVGVGNSVPSYALDVAGTCRIGTADTSTAILEIGVGATGDRISVLDFVGDTTYSDFGLRLIRNSGANANSNLRHRGTGALILESFDSGVIQFNTAGAERLRITSDGKLGLGTSSPAALLHLSSGANTTMRLTDTAGSYSDIIYNESGSVSQLILDADPTGSSVATGGTSILLKTDGTTAMTIDSSQRVGIGTAAPLYRLHIADGDSNWHFRDNSDNAELLCLAEAGKRAAIYFGDSADNVRSGIVHDCTTDALEFRGYNNAERMRIDSSGRLLVGTSSAFPVRSGTTAITPQQQLAGTNGTASTFVQGCASATDSTAAFHWFAKFASGTINDNATSVADGEVLGIITWSGSDGANQTQAAIIRAEVDGTPGANDMPGRIILATTADGGTSPTERMRIDNAGTTMIGGGAAEANGSITIYPNNSNGGAQAVWNRASATAGTTAFNFKNGGTQVGTVVYSNTATAYNTTSDYRLKENVVPLTGAIDRLNDLQVRRFNFIADPTKTVDGFIAHEAQAVVPECVTGTKDEVDADGKPVYQGIDQSKLVPLLTAALQEAIGRIETLEAEVAALKGA
jgi:hypothetical protein